MLIGFLDDVRDGRCFGWVADRISPNKSLSISLYDKNNNCIAKGMASGHRADLEPLGLGVFHGFDLQVGNNLKLSDILFLVDNESHESYPLKYNRRSEKPIFQLSVCAIVKNEGRDIAEWIAFHLMQGVEHFFIFDNASNDNTVEQILRFPDSFITLIDWPISPGQQAAYMYAISKFRDFSQWMAFIDADEFLFSPNGDDLRLVLEPYVNASGVVVHWAVYGSSRKKTRQDDEFVIDSFDLRAPLNFWINGYVKSVLNPRQIIGVCMSPHVFVTASEAVNERGQLVSYTCGGFEANTSCEKLRINHYPVKDFDSWVIKSKKGFADQEGERNDSMFEYYNSAEMNSVNDGILRKYSTQIRRILDIFNKKSRNFSSVFEFDFKKIKSDDYKLILDVLDCVNDGNFCYWKKRLRNFNDAELAGMKTGSEVDAI
ncbi:glycosyltransferase family 2 protein [Acidithiobacillus thiooxidans]|uniref:glycosyltransferase family 2 protein n=1 Tax=Acidithiobacillus thiooxidans TaxID=930 RepID=UPI0035632F70